MNDQPEPPPSPELPQDENQFPFRAPKITWLLVAFIPSLAALVTLYQNPDLGLFTLPFLFLFILNVICSLAAAIGLARVIKSKVEQIFLALFFTGFFFVANLVIALLIGCSHMSI